MISSAWKISINAPDKRFEKSTVEFGKFANPGPATPTDWPDGATLASVGRSAGAKHASRSPCVSGKASWPVHGGCRFASTPPPKRVSRLPGSRMNGRARRDESARSVVICAGFWTARYFSVHILRVDPTTPHFGNDNCIEKSRSNDIGRVGMKFLRQDWRY